jgi:micrococcal nuclease
MDAQAFYEAAGGPAVDIHRLDGDADGVACQSLSGAP